MRRFSPNFDIKSGGNAEATATGHQSKEDATKGVNKSFDLGVANPDISSDEDAAFQAQNAEAGAFGGHGGNDNVYQNLAI